MRGVDLAPSFVSPRYAIDALIPPRLLDAPARERSGRAAGLAAYNAVLQVSADALESFRKNKFQDFDALAGNNSCHLVAMCLLSIHASHAQDPLHFDSISKSISFALNRLHTQEGNAMLDGSRGQTVRDLLIELGADYVPLDTDLTLLSLAYGCTISKSRPSSCTAITDRDQLSRYLQDRANLRVSVKLLERLIRQWQMQLSGHAITRLRHYASLVSKETAPWAKYVTEQYVKKDAAGRLCAPTLYAMRVVVDQFLRQEDYLLVIRAHFVDKPTSLHPDFVQFYRVQKGALQPISTIELTGKCENSPVFVVEGCCTGDIPIDKFKEQFLNHHVIDLIFANDVTYPLYPGALPDHVFSPMEVELQDELIRLAAIKGCSLEDPSLFCITHYAVDSLKSQLLSQTQEPYCLPSTNNQHESEKASHCS